MQQNNTETNELQPSRPKQDWTLFTIDDFRKIAEERGGKCLSTNYVNSHSMLEWQCGKCDNIWESMAFYIKHQGHWCPKCGGTQKLTLGECIEYGLSRGFKCLETEYVNCMTKMNWRCPNGDIFACNFSSLRTGQGCPKCINKTETRETGFSPDWCVNPETKAALRFDIVIHNFKVIIEVDGPQHFEQIAKWTPVEDLRKRDITKHILAYQNGYKILRVVQAQVWKNQSLLCDSLKELVTNPCRIPVFIVEEGTDALYDAHKEDLFTAVGLSPESEILQWEALPTMSDVELTELREAIHMKFNGLNSDPTDEEIAELRNLEEQLPAKLKMFITKARDIHMHKYDYSQVEYKRNDVHIMISCRYHGQFKILPTNHLSHKNGCAVCSNHVPLTLKECQDVAESRGGECLSTEYKTMSDKMHWRCKNGHEWWAKFRDIKHSTSWCARCARCAKLTIEDCVEFGKSIGYQCVSTQYVNVKTKLDWICDNGDEFSACLANMKTLGSRCPKCYKRSRGIKV